VAFLRTHPSGTRWQLLTQSAQEAEQLIIDGVRAGSVGGFNGDDPALPASRLATLVARGEVSYVESGGAFPGRGANGATAAAQKACTPVPSSEWQSGGAGAGLFGARGVGPLGGGPGGRAVTLYDCAGRAAQIRAA